MVVRKENEPFNKFLHRFKKYVEKERVLSDYKKSKMRKREKMKLKQFAAERRRLKKMKKIRNEV